jgi:hypothetical protein
MRAPDLPWKHVRPGDIRSATEIRAMRDALLYRSLANDRATASGVDPVVVVLSWVCDPAMPDSRLDEVIGDMAGPAEISAEDVLCGLPEATEDTEIAALLRRLPTSEVQRIAAAARRIDRLCKADMKGRML